MPVDEEELVVSSDEEGKPSILKMRIEAEKKKKEEKMRHLREFE